MSTTKKKLEYCVASWRDEQDAVTELIAKGWRPQGGVSVITEQDRDGYEHWIYIQAMIRETEEPIP